MGKKYTILGFQQDKLLEFDFDIVDAMILRYFVDFKDTDDMVMIIYEKTPYYWVLYEKLIENIPIIGITSKDALRRRFKKMVDAKVLKHYTLKSGGVFSYYALGENYKCLLKEDTTQKSEGCDSEVGGCDSKVGRVPTQKSEPYDSKVGTNNSSIKYSSIKDNSIYKSIVDYLNKTLKTNYRSSGNNIRKLITARLNDGFEEKDFYTVIDKKFEEWNGTEQAIYLRPETLFGNKFDSYLNQKKAIKKSKSDFNNYEQRTYDYESLERKLLGLDGVDEC